MILSKSQLEEFELGLIPTDLDESKIPTTGKTNKEKIIIDDVYLFSILLY